MRGWKQALGHVGGSACIATHICMNVEADIELPADAQDEFAPTPPPPSGEPPIEDAERADVPNNVPAGDESSSYGDWLAEEEPAEPPPEDAGRDQQ